MYFKNHLSAGPVVQLVEASSHTPKDFGFDFGSEHMPGCLFDPQLGCLQ